MSHYLKIFDFHLNHRDSEGNTTYHALAMNHPELINSITVGTEASDSIQRQLVFDSFKLKLSRDLSSENLKNVGTKKIIKKSKIYEGDAMVTREVLTDYSNKLMYGVLHAGKITNNAILESPTEATEDEEDYTYALLNGDRIYDDFFFMLHVSFRCNIARLFIVNGANNTNVDAVLKKYLRDNLFRAPSFNKTKNSDFIPPEYREEVLNRATVNTVTISKSDTVISQNDGTEYDVEIRLKPRATSSFSRITNQTISKFRRSKVIFGESTTDDENSELKFSIKDPITNKSKTISYGSQNEFIPRIVLTDAEIYTNNNQFDVEGLKDICLEYIRYDGNQLN